MSPATPTISPARRSRSTGPRPSAVRPRKDNSTESVGRLGLGPGVRDLATDHLPDQPFLARLVRRQISDQPAVAQHQNPVADRADLVQPVPDEQDRAAARGQLACQAQNLGALDGAERGGRLVQDQQPRADGPRPWRSRSSAASAPAAPHLAPTGSTSTSTPISASMFAGLRAQPARSSSSRRREIARTPSSSRFSATDSCPTSGNSWATRATPSAAAASVGPGQRLAADLDQAAVAAHGAGQHAHQRGLSGAVLADDADDLAGVQVQLGQVQHPHRPVGLVDAPQPRGDRAAAGVVGALIVT